MFRGDRFTYVGPLAEDGTTAVCEAYDHHIGQQVALKLLPRDLASRPSIVERFLRAAAAVQRCEHANVVQVLDVDVVAGVPLAVMGLVRGCTLQAWLAKRGPMSAGEAVERVLTLCDAVSAVHACGVLHRDVRPENVLINPAGHCSITAFATVPADDGLASVDESADVYGLAYTLLMMLAAGADPDDLARLEGVPAPLVPFLADAMNVERARRFKTVAAFVSELRHARRSLPGGQAAEGREGDVKPYLTPSYVDIRSIVPKPSGGEQDVEMDAASRRATLESRALRAQREQPAGRPVLGAGTKLGLGAAVLLIAVAAGSLGFGALQVRARAADADEAALLFTQALEEQRDVIDDLARLGAERDPLVALFVDASEAHGQEALRISVAFADRVDAEAQQRMGDRLGPTRAARPLEEQRVLTVRARRDAYLGAVRAHQQVASSPPGRVAVWLGWAKGPSAGDGAVLTPPTR